MDEQINYVKSNIFYSIANVLVLNERMQLLVLRRAVWKRINGEDYRPDLSHTLDLPGGIVADTNESESERTGVARELFEETGIEVAKDELKLICAETTFNEQSRRSCSNLIYITRLDYTPEVRLSWEHEDFEWHDLETIAASHEMKGFHDKALNYVLMHREVFNL